MPINILIKSKISPNSGFTLIEMVIVIVLLGILSVGIGSFVKFGSQIYVDATNRDEIVASARFSVERLNRELRGALPNSASAYTNGSGDQCLSFFPIFTSVIYQDIPVSPEPSTTEITFSYDQNEVFPSMSGSKQAAVYPLKANDLNARMQFIDSNNANKPSHIAGNIWRLSLTSSVVFPQDSPTKRLYIVDPMITYCINHSGQMLRTQNNISVLMAEYLTLPSTPFIVNKPTLYRNASVLVALVFSKNNEVITFNNEVQVLNVP